MYPWFGKIDSHGLLIFLDDDLAQQAKEKLERALEASKQTRTLRSRASESAPDGSNPTAIAGAASKVYVNPHFKGVTAPPGNHSQPPPALPGAAAAAGVPIKTSQAYPGLPQAQIPGKYNKTTLLH